MSILVICYTVCNGKEYESRRKCEINGEIPISEIARFFWPRISSNFICKSIRIFDADLDEFVDIEDSSEIVLAKHKYEFRYAESDLANGNSTTSMLNNVFNCRAEQTNSGIAFFLQKLNTTNSNSITIFDEKKLSPKISPNLIDLPSTLSCRNQNSLHSPQQDQSLATVLGLPAKTEIVEVSRTKLASPLTEDVEKFSGELQNFFGTLLGQQVESSISVDDSNTILDENTVTTTNEMNEDLNNIIVPNAIEHLSTQVDRGDFALSELQKYADGEVSFFHEQVKRVITLAMGDYLLDNYFDACTAPVRRYFCSRYLQQLPGNLRPEIFSNSKTVGTVDCYIKNKKKRLRKLSRMAEQGLASTTAPPAKKTKMEPIPDRPKPPKFIDEIRNFDYDPTSYEMETLYKRSYTYRQSLINALNRMPDVDPIEEVNYEFPQLINVPSLLEQDFELCTSRVRQNAVNFEDEWEECFAPIVSKYFESVCPSKFITIDRLYRDAIDRNSLQAFVMVFALLEYNSLTLAQIKTMIIEHGEAPLQNIIEDVRVTRKIPDPVILSGVDGFRVVIGRNALPVTHRFATALKQLVQVHAVFKISHKVLFRPIYQVLESVYGLATNALRFSQRALSLVENLRSFQRT